MQQPGIHLSMPTGVSRSCLFGLSLKSILNLAEKETGLRNCTNAETTFSKAALILYHRGKKLSYILASIDKNLQIG